LIRKRPRTFNRNDGAEGYDVDVQNERDVELGFGTGNLSYGIVGTKVT
jgi:hypothetical protein